MKKYNYPDGTYLKMNVWLDNCIGERKVVIIKSTTENTDDGGVFFSYYCPDLKDSGTFRLKSIHNKRNIRKLEGWELIRYKLEFE